MLARPGFGPRGGEPWREDGQAGRRRPVTVPPDIPAHSRRQACCFDATGLLRRLDDPAQVFSRRARAGDCCSGCRQMSGIMVPARRRVTLRGPGGRPLPGPAMVWIEIGDFELLAHAHDRDRYPMRLMANN